MDCFAPLAMTILRAMAQHGTPHSQSSSPANGSAEWPPCVLPLPRAHEAAGATGIRRFPRPLWADDSAKPRAHRAAGFTRTSREMVIASGAKQSISPRKERMDCFAALAMTVWLFEI